MVKRSRNDTPRGRDSTESVLDALELAAQGEHGDDVTPSLPAGLQDPLKVMERGRELITKGLRLPDEEPTISLYDEEFRMVARNGKAIPDNVRERMHAERQRCESLADREDHEPK
jgi:hypothetical protein